MSVKIIMAQIFKTDVVNSYQFECGNTPDYSPVPDTFQARSVDYFVPEISGGVVSGYKLIDGLPGTIPPDAVKTVRLYDPATNSTYWILGDLSEWVDRINACCGDTTSMPQLSIADPIQTDAPCGIAAVTIEDAEYEFDAALGDDIVTNQKVTAIAKVRNDDGTTTDFTPAPNANGYASIAALLAFMQGSWSAYGTFSAVGTKGIKFVSPSVKKGTFDIQFIDQSYCLTVTPGQIFDSVKVNAQIFPLGKSVTVVNAAQVVNEIAKFLNDGALTASSSTKVQYVGKSAPIGLYIGTASVVNFATGACS